MNIQVLDNVKLLNPEIKVPEWILESGMAWYGSHCYALGSCLMTVLPLYAHCCSSGEET